MPYSAPIITATGLTIPTYQDILDDLIDQAKTIYGVDIYIGVDSPDYQFLSIVAKSIYDSNAALQLIYINSSPQTAIGAALESLVKLNGLLKLVATYSTCTVRVTGTNGITINNGVVSDVNGVLWDLPVVVTIVTGGFIDVLATCQTLGEISALSGDINNIITPQFGWTSVTNSVAATLGNPVETDAELRIRQAVSVALPSQSLFAGTVSGLLATLNVTRIKVYENPTAAPDSYGFPAHSLTCVVEGGTDAAVALTIYMNRGIGVLTNGTTPIVVTDPVTGDTMTINFYRPTPVPIEVEMDIEDLAGYSAATTAAIKDAVVVYLNSLEIGSDLIVSSLYAAALSAVGDISNPLYHVRDIKADTVAGGTPAYADIIIAANEVTSCVVGDIAITLV